MNIYSIKLGSSEQARLIDKLKNDGFEVIQVSDGILAKSEKQIDPSLFNDFEGVSFSDFDKDDRSVSKDARIFAGLDD